MRILFVNDYHDKIGGAEIYIHLLINMLRKQGHVANIISSEKSINEHIESFHDKSINNYAKKLFSLKMYKYLSKKIKEFQPDIIHVHGYSNELSPSFLLAIKDIPIVMTVHNSMLVNAVSILSERTGKECKKRTCGGCRNCVGIKGAMYEFIKRTAHKELLKRVSLYITPSNYMKELVEEAGFGPVKHIPNGFKLYKYSPITNYTSILYIGRLSKEKGVAYLVQAMPAVLRSHPTAKLVIIGDGSEKENLEKLIKTLAIEKSVSIKSNITHEKVENYYKNSTLVVVPSIYHDNLPTVCIEAMSVGRPLIATRMGGIPELIDDTETGILIEPNNSEQLAKAITRLLSNKEKLRIMSKKSFEKSKNYDITRHLASIENTYRNLLGENK